MAWTDEMIENLKKMWHEGLTTGEIGKRLNVSKNSIVGKVHRLGLSGRPSPIKKKDDAQPAAKPAEKKAPAPKAKAPTKAPEPKPEPAKEKETVAPAPLAEKEDTAIEKPIAMQPKAEAPHHNHHNISLTELDNHTCRWPLGDPKDDNFHFCGKKVRIGQTYCDEHAAIAYVRTGKK